MVMHAQTSHLTGQSLQPKVSATAQSSAGVVAMGLLYFTIGAGFFADFRQLVSALGPLGRFVPLLPEAGSALILVFSLLTLARAKALALSPKYLFIGLLIFAHMLIGTIINQMDTGTVVSGIRDYFRFVPIFLLPLVVKFSEQDLKRLFLFILVLCLMQIPVSIYQRLFVYPLMPSGDVVRGTLATGSMVSITMISVISFMGSYWIRGKLAFSKLLCISAILLIPTLINETKATILLFVFGILWVGFLSATGAQRIVRFASTGFVSVVFILAFATAYDTFFPDEFSGMGLIAFYSDRAISNEYLGIDKPEEVRVVPRIDTLVLGYRELAKKPLQLFTGLGIGNVSHPDRNDVLGGEYSDLYLYFAIDRTTYTQALWEIGFIGIFLIGVLTFFVFQDARQLTIRETEHATFGLGWAVVIASLPLALLYKSLIHSSALVILIMFFSGCVAGMRYRSSANVSPSEFQPISRKNEVIQQG